MAISASPSQNVVDVEGITQELFPSKLQHNAKELSAALDEIFTVYLNFNEVTEPHEVAKMVLRDITLNDEDAKSYIPFGLRNLDKYDKLRLGQDAVKNISNFYYYAIEATMDILKDKEIGAEGVPIATENLGRHLLRQHAGVILTHRSQEAICELEEMVNNGTASVKVRRPLLSSPKVIITSDTNHGISYCLEDIFPNLKDGSSLMDQKNAVALNCRNGLDICQISVSRGSAADKKFSQLALKSKSSEAEVSENKAR